MHLKLLTSFRTTVNPFKKYGKNIAQPQYQNLSDMARRALVGEVTRRSVVLLKCNIVAEILN